MESPHSVGVASERAIAAFIRQLEMHEAARAKARSSSSTNSHAATGMKTESEQLRRSPGVFVRTLLWKNWVLKKRSAVGSVLEVMLPCLFILLMGLLKNKTKSVSVPAGWSEAVAGKGVSFGLFDSADSEFPWLQQTVPRFFMHEISLSGMLLALGAMALQDATNLAQLPAADADACRTGVLTRGAVSMDASSPYRLPDACGGKVVPYKIAIVPDVPFTRDYFAATMADWYPTVELLNSSLSPVVPSFRDSVVFYNSSSELDDYIKGKSYGNSASNPRIFGALVFETYPESDAIGSFQGIEYSVRLNSTVDSIGATGQIPSTSGDPQPVYPFERGLNRDYYSRYAVSGFMTLQTLVARFVNCMPVWDPATKTSNGTCQHSRSTATAAADLDQRLLASLVSDISLQSVVMAMENDGGTANSTSNAPELAASAFLSAISSSAREQLLKPLRQAPQPYLGAVVAPFPVDDYVSSPFYKQVKNVFALVFILAYLYCLSRVLTVFICEKESRMREYMKILGVKESAIISSWFLTYAGILLVATVLQALAGLVGLFQHSSVVLVFLFFYLFALSVLAFGFLVSAVFSKARVGAFVGMVLFFLMYFVSVSITPETPESSKSFSCLLSPVALSLGVQVLANLESTGQGLSFDNVSTRSENFRVSTALFFFALDAVLYTIVGLYLDKVVPKEYGTTLPWYFPVSPSYWRGRHAPDQKLAEQGSPGPDSIAVDVSPHVEPVSAELRAGHALRVQRLRKVFAVPGGEKVAVKGLNLDMYKNQITCLLGHNGAGKTTLISMLTGMIAPTSGTATFEGQSIVGDMETIRESLGICFQHDVLFGEMTVEEHLVFFGRVKGYKGPQLDEVVNRQIREVGLTEKRHARSAELSGGMKRKLSVAISLLGDSSLVFLDEPTSGMDPYSRRSTWEILLNNRHGRVMVLTTHFMDEADILGDRIAIMAEGELRCCGSSLFLKNRYGAGYNLTLVKDDSRCDDSQVIRFVTSHVPAASVLSNVGSEIAFQLPLDASTQFATMFEELDASLSTLGLLSYGVSVTTLEEVFIKVAEAVDEDQQHTLNKRARDDDDVPVLAQTTSDEEPEPTAVSLFLVHLGALLLKRFRVAKRDKRMLVFSALLPVLLLLVGLLLLRSLKITADDPKMALTTRDIPGGDRTPVPYVCEADGDSWCATAMSSTSFTGALSQQLALPAFNAATSTVFGVAYSNLSQVEEDSVVLDQTLYQRGFGKENATEVMPSQYGAYMVYGDSARNVMSYNVFVNTSATHGAPVFKALMDQSLYRFFATDGSEEAPTAAQLKINSHPLPLTAANKALFSSFMSFTACLFIVIAFTFFPAAVVVFLVKEKQSEHNAKHQQLVSGVSLGAFWLANYLWDLLVYLVPLIAAVVLIIVFDINALTGNDCASCTASTFPAVILLFVLFGVAICPFTYCLSYLFREHSSAQTYTIVINFVTGVVLMVLSYILDIIKSTKDANAVLVFLWRLSPLFNLGNGLLSLTQNQMEAAFSGEADKKSPFSGDMMGYELGYLFCTAILFSALTVGIDYSLTSPRLKQLQMNGETEPLEADEEDVDVANERTRVATGTGDAEAVVVRNLRKVYPGGKVAVRDLSFGLKRGECFGFLGINGAGKTTTMKMLTGDVLPSAGTATLAGFDILNEQVEVRRQIGYCPQFDALFDLLTVREHLELYARIKGVSRAEVESVVTGKIHQLNLASFEHKVAGSLSGGNKRKLSVAIAMIGDPQIIFLDEPSTGMDPVSRRFMWDVIADISTRSKSSTIVLTTHSMEESEALCSRVGIMVGGRLRCLGSVQHLKHRFGDGLVLDVKTAAPTADQVEGLVHRLYGEQARVGAMSKADLEATCRTFGDQTLAERIAASHPTGYSLAATMEREGFVRAEVLCSWLLEERRFDGLHGFLRGSFGHDNVAVMERQNDFCRFKLRGSSAQLKLSRVFALVEAVKTEHGINEYSVSQTTLEQIFNFFARQQNEETGVARGMAA